MSKVRESLDKILNLVDYTNNQCSVTAPVGAAVPEDAFADAREALRSDLASPVHAVALNVLLDQIDYTADACTPFEMVGACLPKEVIVRARKALETP